MKNVCVITIKLNTYHTKWWRGGGICLRTWKPVKEVRLKIF